jgi:hypothetical protein
MTPISSRKRNNNLSNLAPVCDCYKCAYDWLFWCRTSLFRPLRWCLPLPCCWDSNCEHRRVIVTERLRKHVCHLVFPAKPLLPSATQWPRVQGRGVYTNSTQETGRKTVILLTRDANVTTMSRIHEKFHQLQNWGIAPWNCFRNWWMHWTCDEISSYILWFNRSICEDRRLPDRCCAEWTENLTSRIGLHGAKRTAVCHVQITHCWFLLNAFSHKSCYPRGPSQVIVNVLESRRLKWPVCTRIEGKFSFIRWDLRLNGAVDNINHLWAALTADVAVFLSWSILSHGPYHLHSKRLISFKWRNNFTNSYGLADCFD